MWNYLRLNKSHILIEYYDRFALKWFYHRGTAKKMLKKKIYFYQPESLESETRLLATEDYKSNVSFLLLLLICTLILIKSF